MLCSIQKHCTPTSTHSAKTAAPFSICSFRPTQSHVAKSPTNWGNPQSENWKTCSGKCRSFTRRTAIFTPPTPQYVSLQTCVQPYPKSPNPGGTTRKQPRNLLETSATAPAAIRENTASLIRDLTTLLGIVTQRLPRRLKHGGISKTDLRDANKYCHIQDDPGYIEFLTLFAETTGLIKPQDMAWHTASDAGTRVGQIIDTRKACFEFWSHSERWNEWSSDRTKPPVPECKCLRISAVKSCEAFGIAPPTHG